MFDGQGAMGLPDEAGFDAVLAGEPGQCVGLEWVAPLSLQVPDQQRLLLPAVSQKTVGLEFTTLHRIIASRNW